MGQVAGKSILQRRQPVKKRGQIVGKPQSALRVHADIHFRAVRPQGDGRLDISDGVVRRPLAAGMGGNQNSLFHCKRQLPLLFLLTDVHDVQNIPLGILQSEQPQMFTGFDIPQNEGIFILLRYGTVFGDSRHTP